jgi:hypothetical protein
MPSARPSFLEFFAGGGMAHVGLDGRFDCAFANDLDAMKCAAYRANFPDARSSRATLNPTLKPSPLACNVIEKAGKGRAEDLVSKTSPAFIAQWPRLPTVTQLADAGYRVGATLIDAAPSPQSGKDHHRAQGPLPLVPTTDYPTPPSSGHA